VFRHCLFCDAAFPQTRVLDDFPHGSRLAFDPARERLWVICDACHRWTLAPAEVRASVIGVLERCVRDRGQLLVQTSHVALFQADLLTLLRVGSAGPAEEAWWRYGRELQRRQERIHSRGARWGAYSLVAVARVGESLGLSPIELDPTRADSAVTGVLRLRFGSTAWEGRISCPYCRSVLLSLPFDYTWWLLPRLRDQALELLVPCTRCDPWTPENTYRLRGADARRVLRRALAYQNVGGGSDRQIELATGAIDAAGSPDRLIAGVSTGRQSLWSLGKDGALALEIALSDAIEAEQLRAQVRELEAAWRVEEALADIIDGELGGP
jgi:hypothetical protein